MSDETVHKITIYAEGYYSNPQRSGCRIDITEKGNIHIYYMNTCNTFILYTSIIDNIKIDWIKCM